MLIVVLVLVAVLAVVMSIDYKGRRKKYRSEERGLLALPPTRLLK